MDSGLDLLLAVFQLGIFLIIFLVAMLVVMTISFWRIYAAHFDEPGWKSLIPFLNIWILFEKVYGKGWIMFTLLIPFIGALLGLYFQFSFAKAMGRSAGFAIGMILLPIVFIPMMAFSQDSCYEGPVEHFIFK